MESTTIDITKVDLAFAEMVMRRYQLKDSWLNNFLSEMMAKTRHGHVCIHVEKEDSARLPKCLLSTGEKANKLLVIRGESLYFHRYWYLETKLLLPIIRRLKHKSEKRHVEIAGLNKEQNHAVICALSHQLTLIVGGPGTGKTHTISHIVNQLSDKHIALCAPTGKAVSKLSQSIEDSSCFFGTLHALLGIKQAKDILKKPSLIPYDVVIVDECSMIDIGMWGVLLEACAPGTKLILVGDADQLPPIEGGHVFEQLSAFFKNTKQPSFAKLSTCMRTDREDLQAIASQVLSNQTEQLPCVDIPSISELIKHVNPIFLQKVDDHTSTNALLGAMSKFQILSALRKGPHGCDALNKSIFLQIKEKTQKDDCLAVPIIVTRNAPDLNLSNGDTGVWMHGENDQIIFKDKIIPKAMVPAFEFAYVLSVHKSQGSEYDHVYLLLPPGSEHFGRSVLYTAITRARNQLTIAGSYDTVQLCAQNNAVRLAGLSERLGEMLCKN